MPADEDLPEDSTDAEQLDTTDLMNSERMAIPSRAPGWVVLALYGHTFRVTNDVADKLAQDLVLSAEEAAHRGIGAAWRRAALPPKEPTKP